MASHRDTFRPAQLGALSGVLPVARELTGHYFALPDRWFEETSHEVCTRKDLRRGEVLDGGRLAQIRRLYRVFEASPGQFLRCQRFCPHYRICLQDHNLLAVARRQQCALEDVLTWVLTHEYVHLVRFRRFEHSYDAPIPLREDEEARVERLTRTILSRLGGPGVRRLVARLDREERGLRLGKAETAVGREAGP